MLVFVMIQFVLLPFFAETRRLQQGIASRRANLAEMRELSRRYRQLNDRGGELEESLEARDGDFSLFSFLEKKATEIAVKDKIAYMKPSEQTERGDFRESVVEMKLQGVTLRQLVDFLEGIESPENVVSIRRISIMRNRKQGQGLDAIMQVVTLKRAAS